MSTPAPTRGSKAIPRDARLIALMLASLGAGDCEPGVVSALLEFAHRYTAEILTESVIYAEHARRAAGNAITIEDIKLAVQAKLEHSNPGLPKEFVLPLASQVNRVPLPLIPESYGLRLPPIRDRLTAVNFDIIPQKRKAAAELVAEKQEQLEADGEDEGDLFGSADEEEDLFEEADIPNGHEPMDVDRHRLDNEDDDYD